MVEGRKVDGRLSGVNKFRSGYHRASITNGGKRNTRASSSNDLLRDDTAVFWQHLLWGYRVNPSCAITSTTPTIPALLDDGTQEKGILPAIHTVSSTHSSQHHRVKHGRKYM
jgi:hypothetical protein